MATEIYGIASHNNYGNNYNQLKRVCPYDVQQRASHYRRARSCRYPESEDYSHGSAAIYCAYYSGQTAAYGAGHNGSSVAVTAEEHDHELNGYHRDVVDERHYKSCLYDKSDVERTGHTAGIPSTDNDNEEKTKAICDLDTGETRYEPATPLTSAIHGPATALTTTSATYYACWWNR